MSLIATIFGIALASTPTASPPVPAPGLEGTWQGFLNPNPMAEIRLILRVEKTPEGKLRARVESPDLKTQPAVSFDDATLVDDRVVLIAKSDNREFQATLDPSGREMKGDWKKGAVSTPLTFQRVEGPVPVADIWEGALSVGGGIKLRLAFHALKTAPDTYRATMNSIDQGVYGLKVTEAEIGPETLRFTVKNIGEFQGQLDASGSTAEGTWKQGGLNLPLTLKKVESMSEVRRPQVPKPPFPYVSEEVAYDSRAQGIRIAGTLTIPEGDGPFPAALLITGSGSQDRDETLLGHKPFLVLADDLTRRGIAVLRVDDRGVGRSTGKAEASTTLDFVEDVLGGVDFLKTRKRIDPKRIGLIGHSEGGLIAPIVATRSGDVAFLVLMAGPGLPGDQIIASQVGLILKATGADEATIRTAVDGQKRLMKIVQETGEATQALERLKKEHAELFRNLPEAQRQAALATDPGGKQLEVLNSPWFRYFLGYDPRPTLAKVACPILAINGEKDLQVPCQENLEAIEKAVREGGKARLTTRPMAGLNHLFQTCTTGSPSEYGSIEETFAPAALQVIGEWVVSTTRP